MGRSRSYSRSWSRSRSRDRRRSHSRSPDEARLHVADLGIDCSKREIERVFEKYGKLEEVWLARNPPCFAFVVFDNKIDADDALRHLDGTMLCGGRIRVTYARPRTRGRGRTGWDPNMRCYQCGEKGHFSRDCLDTKYGYRRPPSRGRYYGGGGGNRRVRSRSKSRGRRSRSTSKDRGYRSHHRSREHKKSTSKSRSKSRDRKRSHSHEKRRSSEKSRSVSQGKNSASGSVSPKKEESVEREASNSPAQSGGEEEEEENSFNNVECKEDGSAEASPEGENAMYNMVDVDTAERSPSQDRSPSQ